MRLAIVCPRFFLLLCTCAVLLFMLPVTMGYALCELLVRGCRLLTTSSRVSIGRPLRKLLKKALRRHLKKERRLQRCHRRVGGKYYRVWAMPPEASPEKTAEQQQEQKKLCQTTQRKQGCGQLKLLSEFRCSGHGKASSTCWQCEFPACANAGCFVRRDEAKGPVSKAELKDGLWLCG